MANKIQGSIDVAGDGSLVEAVKEILDNFLDDHLQQRLIGCGKPEIKIKEDRMNYYKVTIDLPIKRDDPS